MMKAVRFRTLALCAIAPLTLACATKGALRRAMTEQRTALANERSERLAGDSATSADVQTLRTEVRADIEALRRDLQGLRSEFGAKIAQVEEGLQFAFPVNFAFDDATVREQDMPALDRFSSVVQRYYGGAKLTVEGFADPAGSQAYNKALSQRRADAVRAYLAQRGLAQEVQAVGYGETRQVVPGAERDAPGAEMNRRVVFVVESKPQTGVAMALPEGK
jgi:peptidoglycan-associated lipoprotein